MANENKQPCPYCKNLIFAQAKVCQYCQKQILYSLKLLAKADSKQSHLIARELLTSAGKASIGDYPTIKRLLTQTSEPLFTYLNKQEADFFSNTLNQHQLANSIELQEELAQERTSSAGSKIVRQLAFALLAIAVVSSLLYLHFDKQKKQAVVTEWQQPQSSPLTATEARSVKTKNKFQPLQDKKLPKNINLTANSIKKLIAATVAITDGKKIGSGFFVDNNGHIITNSHVVKGMIQPQVLPYGRKPLPARVLAEDSNLDLALLRVAGNNYPYLPLGDSTILNQGDTVWTIGSPHGLKFTLTKGIVSYVGRKFNGKAYIQSDVAINPGNSGGPMLNDSGEVVGVNTFIISKAEGLNFALPINYAYMGESAMLSPILGHQPANAIFSQWQGGSSAKMRFASEQQGPDSNLKRYSRQQAPSSGNSTLNSLYQQDQQMAATLNSKKAKIEAKQTSLQARHAAISSKYKAIDRLTVSQEEKLGKQKKEIDMQLMSSEIEYNQLYLDYYKKRLPLLKQMLGLEGNASKKELIRKEIEDVKRLQNVVQVNLETSSKNLMDIREKKY